MCDAMVQRSWQGQRGIEVFSVSWRRVALALSYCMGQPDEIEQYAIKGKQRRNDEQKHPHCPRRKMADVRQNANRCANDPGKVRYEAEGDDPRDRDQLFPELLWFLRGN